MHLKLKCMEVSSCRKISWTMIKAPISKARLIMLRTEASKVKECQIKV